MGLRHRIDISERVKIGGVEITTVLSKKTNFFFVLSISLHGMYITTVV